MTIKNDKPRDMDTTLIHAGRDPQRFEGAVNTPIFHASTILFPDAQSIRTESHPSGNEYGRNGTSTTRALEEAVSALEGGERTVTYPSGAGAVAGAFLTVLKAGDHFLIADNVYGPSRRFCNQVLSSLGVDCEFYDPALGGDIVTLFRPETRALFMESPGTATFEVCDVPAMCQAAREKGIITILDNTWSAGLYFRAFEHGVDMTVHAGTKYVGGHADVMLGMVTTSEKLYPKLKQTAKNLGACAGPEVCYLALRGLRTLSLRFPRHFDTGLKLAQWLDTREEVETVLHPALPSCPGHEIWKRDFTGASGLFGVVLKDYSTAAVDALLDNTPLFGLGYSWGGYESLIIPTDLGKLRTATTWHHKTPVIRIHAGLESYDDLRADLEVGLDCLRSTN
ncbi:MAG: cystathionine beta-lyase [Rhodospirillales bacterium]|nr:cystathionine beta-lyase [Rhodospirillales bacterium]